MVSKHERRDGSASGVADEDRGANLIANCKLPRRLGHCVNHLSRVVVAARGKDVSVGTVASFITVAWTQQAHGDSIRDV